LVDTRWASESWRSLRSLLGAWSTGTGEFAPNCSSRSLVQARGVQNELAPLSNIALLTNKRSSVRRVTSQLPMLGSGLPMRAFAAERCALGRHYALSRSLVHTRI